MKTLLKGTFTIQEWSVWLVIACLLPAAIAITLLIYASYQRERADMERTTIQTARALVQSVDRELSSAQGALQALATSPHLAARNMAAFDAQAREALRNRPGNALVLTDAGGRELVNTQMPFGAPLPMHGNPAHLRRVLAESQPLVSDLYFDQVSRQLLISVDVPVQRGKASAYVLSMHFFPAYFGASLGGILKQQRLPPEVVASIFDSAGVIVARTHSPAQFIGKKGAPALVQRLMEIPEGSVETATLEGIPVIAAFSRSALSSWSVAIGVPQAGVTRRLWKSVSLVVAGSLLLMLGALVLARSISSRITRSISALVAPAMALGHGAPATLAPLALREAEEVRQALAKASSLLRERTAERDHAEQSEREMRAVKLQLEHSEALQRGIFEEAPDAILLVATSGRIMRANLEAERLFGYPRARLLSMTVDDLVPEAVRQRHAGLRGEFLAHPRRRLMGMGKMLAGRRADGAAFPIDVMLSPLRSADGELLIIATVRDVTESMQKTEAISAALREKETLLKELYHRVKNNLQVITSLFNLQMRTLPDGLAREALKEGAGRVHAMALVHEKLYQSKNLSSISLDEYIAELGNYLGTATAAEQSGIALLYDTEPLQAGLETAVPLGLLLNELICNSLKHAFPGGRRGSITVRLHRRDERMAELAVVDTGVGFPAGLNPTSSPSLGLKLVAALSAQLDGKLAMHTEHGARVSLLFPLAGRGKAGHVATIEATA